MTKAGTRIGDAAQHVAGNKGTRLYWRDDCLTRCRNRTLHRCVRSRWDVDVARHAAALPDRICPAASLAAQTLWRLPLAIAGYLGSPDRGLLKSRAIRAVMGGDRRSTIEAWAESFVGSLQPRRAFRPAALAAVEAHRAAGGRLVLLSASPDLYVPGIGRLLGFERTLCTEVQWRHIACEEDRLDGALRTPNRRDEEKSRCLAWLRTEYPNLPVVAYGNSRSDISHLREADRAFLVNGSAATRRAASAAGIPVANWT